MPASALRPRSVTEIVDVAFQIYRTHFTSLAMCSAIAYVPAMLVRFLLIGDPNRFRTLDPSHVRDFALVSLESSLAGVFSYMLMSAVLTICASQAYLGEAVDIGVAVRRTVSRLGALIVSTIIVTILVFVGIVLLVAPGIYVLAMYFAVTPVILLEDTGVLAALTRSSELSKGRKWHILVTMFLVGLIYFVVLMGLSIVTALAGGFVVQGILAAIVTICLYPVVPIASLLLYYDARIQSEGLDIELMADALGPISAPAVS
jgi:hypothetical protein